MGENEKSFVHLILYIKTNLIKSLVYIENNKFELNVKLPYGNTNIIR